MLAQKPFDNVVSSGDPHSEQMRRPIGHSSARALLHRGFIGAGGVLLIAAFGTDYTYYTMALRTTRRFTDGPWDLRWIGAGHCSSQMMLEIPWPTRNVRAPTVPSIAALMNPP